VSTLGIMKERIASELRRDDLSSATEFVTLNQVSDIHNAILTAIGEYQREKFYFSEDRGSVLFDTVAAQDIYTSVDEPDIARIVKIEWAYAIIGGTSIKLWPRRADLMEGSNTGDNALSGQPAFYSWYGESIRIEPIPNDVFSLRFGCVLKTTAPASDSETGNRWMTDAELLIRSRAKAELYRHVIKDAQKADLFQAAANDALSTLRDITDSKTVPEIPLVEVWDPYANC
jgi:hypothetical protein